MESNDNLKCEKCGIFFKKNGYNKHISSCNLSSNDVECILKKYIYDFYSIDNLQKEYKISKNLISKILGNKVRSVHESRVIAHYKYPESYITSDETKEKLRTSRLKFMKEHPEQTAWRLKNMSYPEKLFKDALEANGFDKKYLIEREHSVFPYFIDFAFINEKLAVEIDGSQHLLNERKIKDFNKDKLLNDNGWSVYRVTANQVKYSISDVLCEISNILEKPGTSNNVSISNITEYVSKVKKNKLLKDHERKLNNGYTNKQIAHNLKQRKVERPDYITLCDEIETLGYSATGRKYGVSDNAIRKWRKKYENDFNK